MKPDWDKLMSAYADAKKTGIYDVDCTDDGKELCEELGVTSYPTLKYGDPRNRSALVEYHRDRDFYSLKRFVSARLDKEGEVNIPDPTTTTTTTTTTTPAPECGPDKLNLCSSREKDLIDKFSKMPSAELLAQAKKLDKGFAKRQKKLEKRRKKLQTLINEFEIDFNDYGDFYTSNRIASLADNLQRRRAKIEGEKAIVNKEDQTIKREIADSGVRLMKLIAEGKQIAEASESQRQEIEKMIAEASKDRSDL